MGGNDISLKVVLAAQNLVGSAFTSLGGMLRNLSGLAGLTSGALLSIGAAAVGIGVAAVQMAGQYDQSMRMIQSLTGASSDQMAFYDAQLKQLAMNAGVAPNALAQGLYNVLSAGYQGAQAMSVLTLATEDAKIGMTDAKTTTNALTVALKAFNVPASQFNAVNGEMLRTVTAGKMTMQDYASAISKTSSVAVQYKDNMSDMNAVLATLTSSGIKNANVAGTDYNNLLKVLNGNTAAVAKASHAINPAFNQNAFAAMNVHDKVMYLNKMIVQHGHNITEVIGKQQNAAAAFTMLSTHAGTYTQNLKSLSDQQKNANETSQAWAITQGGFNQSLSRLNASIQVLLIDLGQQLLPILTPIINNITTIVSGIANWATKNHVVQRALDALHTAGKTVSDWITTAIGIVKNIISWFQQWHGVILSVAGVVTAFFLPALIKTGVEAGITGAKLAGSFIANIAKSGVEAVVNGAKITGQFVASLIKTGLEGWQAAGKLGLFIGQLIATGAKAAWSAAVMAGKFIWGLIQSGVEAGKTAAVFMAKMIPALISMAADGIMAVVGAMPGLIGGLIGATGAAWGFTASLLANPITWIVLAIIALITAIVLLATHWKQVTAAIGIAIGWLGQQIGRLGNWFHQQIALIGAIFSWLGTQIHAKIQEMVARFDAFRSSIQMHIQQIISFFQQLPGRIGQFFEQLALNIATKLINFKTMAQQKVQDVITTIVNFFKNLPSQALQWGKDMVQGFINGLMNMVGAVGNAAQNIGNKIKSFLHFSKPDTGPLADFDQWMPDMMNLMTAGIIAGHPKLQAAVQTTAKVLAGAGSPPAQSSGYGSIPYGQPPISSSYSSYAGGGNHYGNNSIVINGAGQNPDAIANAVMQRLNRQYRSSGLMGNPARGMRDA